MYARRRMQVALFEIGRSRQLGLHHWTVNVPLQVGGGAPAAFRFALPLAVNGGALAV